MDNATDNGMDNGLDSATKAEINSQFQEDAQESTLNRNQLMDLPTKKLAKMAQPYSTKTLKTLEKTAKSTLCDLILNKGDGKPKEETTYARTGTAQSETEQFIGTALMMLSAMKQNRDGEPLNAMAAEVFKKQAVVYADDKVKNGEMDINKSSNALLYISAGAILFDGLIGFKNTPTLFQKIKDKFTKRPGQKKDDSK